MSGAVERVSDPVAELAHDKAVERRLPWKGALSLIVVLALGYARLRWWV